MNMRTLSLVVAMVLSGCLVPLDIDGDAGRDAGGVVHEDSGVVCDPPADAGPEGIDWSMLPCTLPVLEAQEAGAVAVLLPGCKQPVQVFSASGAFAAEVAVDAIGTRVSSPQWPPGVYVLRTGSGATEREVMFEVYSRPTNGTVRAFSEPVEDCFRIGVTTEGRVACERREGSRQGITLYELDGSVRTRFPGEHLAIAGNELWTLGGGGLELRVDGASGPALRASIVDARLVTNGGAVNFGETTPGRSVRGSATELIEFTWDGVSSTLTAGTAEPMATGSSGFILRDGASQWNGALCRCTNGVCPGAPSPACPWGESVLAGYSTRVVFVASFGNGRTTVSELLRPINPTFPPLARVVPFRPGVYFARPLLERPVFMTTSGDQHVVLMSSDPLGQRTHFAVFSERIVGVDQQQVVSLVDSTHLRFTPNP